jgi:hypothetical protein
VRARTDEQLAALVRRRPDLARPAPSDLTSLAARASTRASVQRAVNGLDQAHLRVLRALSSSGDRVSVAATARALDASRAEVQACVDHLRELALVWDGSDGAHVVRTVTDVLSQLPSAPLLSAPQPAPATTGSPGDRPSGRPGDGPGPSTDGAEPAATQSSRAPGKGLHPPPLSVQARAPKAVDDAGGAAASDLLEMIDELARTWELRPPRVLRSGGLAVRDLRRLAADLDIEVPRAGFLAETAYSAGLIGEDTADRPLEPGWAPTPAYDDWRERRPWQQWAHLASAWLGSPRASHRIGTSPAETAGPVNALSSGVLSSPSRQVRLEALAELARLARGEAPEADSLVARLAWRRPLRPAELLGSAARAALREAEWLGVSGRGALTTAGAALVTGAGVEDVAALMKRPMPAAVDHVLIQADLTAVAPGRLEGELAALMRLVADVESRGGATVYRLRAESIRRAMDAGWSADQLLVALRAASATPLPQPLEYLVGDVARRHGATRVGTVTSYVRSDDVAALDSMTKERALAPLQLRRIAPTVLVSSSSASVVLELLRSNGFAPVVEGADGGVRVPRQKQHRAVGRRAPTPVSVSVVDETAAASLVSALRAAEEVAASLRLLERDRPGPPLPSTDPTVALALMQEAAASARPLWIGYSDREGVVTRHLFWPRRVEAGRAYGLVDGSSVERAFSIHRITGASVG